MKKLIILAALLFLALPAHSAQAAKSISDLKSQYNAKARLDCASHYGSKSENQRSTEICQQKVFNQLEKLCQPALDSGQAARVESCFQDKYAAAKDKTGIFGAADAGGSNPGGSLGSLGSAASLNIPDVSFNTLAANVIRALSLVAAAIAAIYLVLGGIKYSTSNGDPTAIANAKRTITYAIAGLVVSIVATAIVAFVAGRAPQ